MIEYLQGMVGLVQILALQTRHQWRSLQFKQMRFLFLCAHDVCPFLQFLFLLHIVLLVSFFFSRFAACCCRMIR